jgi:hypothetical protein
MKAENKNFELVNRALLYFYHILNFKNYRTKVPERKLQDAV